MTLVLKYKSLWKYIKFKYIFTDNPLLQATIKSSSRKSFRSTFPKSIISQIGLQVPLLPTQFPDLVFSKSNQQTQIASQTWVDGATALNLWLEALFLVAMCNL